MCEKVVHRETLEWWEWSSSTLLQIRTNLFYAVKIGWICVLHKTTLDKKILLQKGLRSFLLWEIHFLPHHVCVIYLTILPELMITCPQWKVMLVQVLPRHSHSVPISILKVKIFPDLAVKTLVLLPFFKKKTNFLLVDINFR